MWRPAFWSSWRECFQRHKCSPTTPIHSRDTEPRKARPPAETTTAVSVAPAGLPNGAMSAVSGRDASADETFDLGYAPVIPVPPPPKRQRGSRLRNWVPPNDVVAQRYTPTTNTAPCAQLTRTADSRMTCKSSLSFKSYRYEVGADGKMQKVANKPEEGFAPDKRLLARSSRFDAMRNKLKRRGPDLPVYPERLVYIGPRVENEEALAVGVVNDSLFFCCAMCKLLMTCEPHAHLPCREHRVQLRAPLDSVPIRECDRIPVPAPGTERFAHIEWLSEEVVNGVLVTTTQAERQRRQQEQLEEAEHQRILTLAPRPDRQQQAPPKGKRRRMLHHLKDQCSQQYAEAAAAVLALCNSKDDALSYLTMHSGGGWLETIPSAPARRWRVLLRVSQSTHDTF